MTTNGTAPRPSEMSGQILTEAARRMLPVLAGRVLTAVADQAVAKVEGLADRLDQSRTGDQQEREDAPASEGGSGRAGAAVAFLMEQARLFLAFVARLAAQALEMLRWATEKLRSRRAPEGIDEAPAPEEISAPEDLEDDEYEDEYDDYEDDLEDDEVEERAPAHA
ncbi:hypothetical protein ACQPX6_30065 [Actinomycetospora sp. CA-101289]|uniref:hypothetical protein n=1 Tax=Actinomycetospora sp. CA-101289 TaxID=3239893 RepID=UPI003D991CA8